MTVEVSDHRRRRRRRHATRVPRHRVLAAVLGVFAAVAGFGLVFVETSLNLADDGFTTQDISALLPSVTPSAEPSATADADPEDLSAGKALNILLMGSDTREGEDNQELGKGDVGGMRNDTTMIMHISADRERVELLSIPRDSRVAVSDCKMLDGSTVYGWTGKFNIAFSNGGQNGNIAEAAACVATTIYDLTGLLVDHYAVVDFSGFVDMVDALDGVPMCITQDVYSPKAHLELEAGAQVLDGTTALAWARARTGTGLGDGTDLMRIERQQELLTNMARKALGLNVLTDAKKGTKFINALAGSMTMDPELGDSRFLLGLAWSLRSFDTSNLYMATVPWQYAGDSSGDVLWTQPDAQEAFDALIADESLQSVLEPETEASTDDSTSSGSTSKSNDKKSSSASAAPSASPSPLRETEDEILADCVID
ncbi:LCP family protein [Demequina sp. SYSU T00192]|uniref:LCP family protein n=1 Tax=Demequina litoralis TaxID=3051660 RepID=A0ABT8G6Z9_9MICO|nr:LCP family protein [Demequina sp. SYSU T00192]MDN4474917.1 LCP family protein [Demequina sp. SYSU T00192]